MVIQKLEKYALTADHKAKEEIPKERNLLSKGKIYETEEEKNLNDIKLKTRNHSDFNIHKDNTIRNLPNRDLDPNEVRRNNINYYQNNKIPENYLRKTVNEKEIRNEKLRNNCEFDDFSSKSTLRGELNHIDKEISELQNKLRNYV